MQEKILAEVQGFGLLTEADTMDAWVSALLYLRATVIERLGDAEGHEAFSESDLIASFIDCAVGFGDQSRPLRKAAAMVAEIGWEDTVRKLAVEHFETRHAG